MQLLHLFYYCCLCYCSFCFNGIVIVFVVIVVVVPAVAAVVVLGAGYITQILISNPNPIFLHCILSGVCVCLCVCSKREKLTR